MKISDIYTTPKHIKNCLLCGKEISTKWKDDLCEACRIKLELNPKKFKFILEIFKIHNHQKDDGGSQMAKETKTKETKKEVTENKRVAIVFYENELSGFGLGKDARPREIGNVIRKKFGMEEVVTQRSGKRKQLIEKLGLAEDATQKDINDAVMELDLE